MDDFIMIEKKLNLMPPEIEVGNREYKWKLTNFDSNRIDKFASQMKYRLYQGKGKALYLVGVLDDGTPIGLNREELENSINRLLEVTKILGAKVSNIRIYNGNEGNIATLRIYVNDTNIISEAEHFNI